MIDKNYNPKRKWTYDEKDAMELTKIQAYYSQDGVCATCGLPLDPQIYDAAHVIPKHNYCIKNYGWNILNHKLNIKATHHCARCNDAVMISPQSHPEEALALIMSIQEEIDNEETY